MNRSEINKYCSMHASKYIFLALFSFGYVFIFNFVSSFVISGKSEYQNSYNASFSKGFLTEDELSELSKLRNEIDEKDSERKRRLLNFVLLYIFSIAAFTLGLYFFTSLNIFPDEIKWTSVVVYGVSVVSSGSYIQSVVWLASFCVAVYLLRVNKRGRT